MASAPDYLKLALELGIGGIYALPSGDHLYCRCPLHNDRSASFSLNISNGLWFCHAEQRGGTFTHLVMEVLGTDPFAAERWIQANSYIHVSPTPLLETQRGVPVLYDDTLAQYANAEMPKYWFDRGYTWETVDRFDIRFDKPNGRLAIPVRFPLDGPVTGIIYRSVSDPSWKYRNTPDFPKKTTLYAYDPQFKPETIMLTEGPLDALKAIQSGYPAHATFGAYVTDVQLALLRSYASATVIVAYDNPALDAAGRETTRNVALALLANGFDPWLFKFPANRKDIGECSSDEISDGIERRHRNIPF